MTIDTYEIEDLEREIEQLRKAQPHLQTLLDAFSPLLMEKNRWLSETAVDPTILPIDPLRFAEGISFNQQQRLFSIRDPWGSAGWSVVNAITQGFPNLTEDMKVILRRVTEGNFDCFSLFFTSDEDVNGQLVPRAEEFGISTDSFHFFLRVLNRFMLTKKARDMKMQLTAHPWTKGYCPLCGSFPHMAILGEKGQRLLQCADCGHAWPFSRLACPYCDHEDPQNTNIFFIDGQNENAAFTCDKCRRYLLTANRSACLGHPPADLIAIGLTHLDIILQEKGYSPMTECDWNSFYR
jgi:FdhE protein